MKIFIDTASLKEIREAQAMGILDGVTTNPSLISKETGDLSEILKEICKIVQGPVSAEVVSTRFEEMVEEGRSLGKDCGQYCCKSSDQFGRLKSN